MSFSGQKIPGDIETVTFNATFRVAAATTITGMAWSVLVLSGVETTPTLTIFGTAQSTGLLAMQQFQGGTAGVWYIVLCQITFSDNQKITFFDHLQVAAAS
jgi:hypothetical protein